MGVKGVIERGEGSGVERKNKGERKERKRQKNVEEENKRSARVHLSDALRKKKWWGVTQCANKNIKKELICTYRNMQDSQAIQVAHRFTAFYYCKSSSNPLHPSAPIKCNAPDRPIILLVYIALLCIKSY